MSAVPKRKKGSAEHREDAERRAFERISGGLGVEPGEEVIAAMWRLPTEADNPFMQGGEAEREQMREEGLFDRLGWSPLVQDRAVNNVVMNIKVSYYDDPNEPRFGRWQLFDERSKALYDAFSAFVYLCNNPQYCLPEERIQALAAHRKRGRPFSEYSGDHRYENGMPNVVFHCERVYTSARPREFVVARMWFTVLNPDFSFGRGIENLIEELDQERRKAKAGTAPAVPAGSRRTRDGWKSLTSLERWIAICDGYRYVMHAARRPGVADSAHAVSLADANPYSPYAIFSIENAMKVDIAPEVRQDQRTVVNYRARHDSECVAFPHSNFVFMLPPGAVRLDMMMALPLPGNHADTYVGRMRQDVGRGGRGMMMVDVGEGGDDDRLPTDASRLAEVEEMIRGWSINDRGASDAGRTAVSEAEAQLIESCAEYRTQLANQKDMAEAVAGLEPGSKDYNDRRAASQMKALRRTEGLLQSDDVASGPWREARKYVRAVLRKRSNLSVEVNKCYEDSTVFQNMLISMMYTIEMEMTVHVNHFSFMLLLPVAYNSWDLFRGLHYNVMFAGKGSAGKSMLMDLLADWHVPGTVKPSTHRTAQAYNTTETHIDGCKVYGEAPHDDMCIDEYGKPKLANPETKERMSSCISSTQEFSRDPLTGERKTTYIHRLTVECIAVATNMSLDRVPEELRSRWVAVYVKDHAREDVTAGEAKNRSKSTMDKEQVERSKEAWRLRHMLCIYVYKYISCGVLCRVKRDIGEMAIEDVEAYLRGNHFISAIHHRVKVQMLLYMEFLTIMRAVHIVFNTEYSHWKGIRDAPFKPEMLLLVEQFLYITEEVAWFTIGLFHEHILPVVPHRIMHELAKLAGEGSPPIDTLDDPFLVDEMLAAQADLAEAKNRSDMASLEPAKQAIRDIEARRAKLRFAKEGDKVDYHYIEVPVTLKSAVEEISNRLEDEAPSKVDIENIISKGTSRNTLVPSRDKEGKVIPGKFERIVSMKFGRRTDDKEKRVLFVCIEFLRDLSPTIIEDAIRSTFHAHTRERKHKVLLGKKARVNINGRSTVAHCVFSSIEVKPNPHVLRERHNPYALDEETLIVGYKWSGQTEFARSKMARASVIQIRGDYEEIIARDHMAEVGIAIDGGDGCGFEPTLEKHIDKYLRPLHFPKELCLRNYPEPVLRRIQRHIEEKSNLKTVDPERTAVAGPKYSSYSSQKDWDAVKNHRSQFYLDLQKRMERRERMPRVESNPDGDDYSDSEQEERGPPRPPPARVSASASSSHSDDDLIF